FLAGPSSELVATSADAVGRLVTDSFRMSRWAEPFTESKFVQGWTVFYWAWWIALGPCVGMFIAKISRGRTLRGVVFGVLGYGSLGCVLCFSVLGNYALHLELTGEVPIVATFENGSPAAAVVATILSLPGGRVLLLGFFFLCVSFAATTYDSASYTLAVAATTQLDGEREPARWHRVFWALALGVLPLVLLFIGRWGSEGEDLDESLRTLKLLQSASIVVSLPLIFVGAVLAVSMARGLVGPGRSKSASGKSGPDAV
ncbi:MAG: BCCT family transporter, partial [Planctomycetota bacterium]